MEIEIGEYGRTEFGIGKIKKITIEPEVDIGIGIMPEVKALWINEHEYFEEKDITNHSKNIIDLIEVGDYVNGHLVVEISKNAYNQKIVITEVDGKDGAIRHHYLERNIKNVVTHEQMQSIEYKVEEGK